MKKNVARKWYFVLKAPNNETIAVSEAYESKQGCENGIEAVRKYASDALLVIID